MNKEMKNNFVSGVLFSLGFIFTLSFITLVFASGTHEPSHIFPGIFGPGDFTFDGAIVLGENTSEVGNGTMIWNGSSFLGFNGSLWVDLNSTTCDVDPAPSGTVIFHNDTSCPSGYTEVTSARGRYIVGLNSGGTLEGTTGTALSDAEDRQVGRHNHGDSFSASSTGSHTHSITGALFGSGYGGTGGRKASSSSTNSGGSHSHSVSGSTGNDGSVSGTNSPYIQYLVCIKN